MGALLITLLLTLAVALRAGVWHGRLSPAESERTDERGVYDACARALVLVLMSLFGLLALGVMYGNVLGSGGVGLCAVR